MGKKKNKKRNLNTCYVEVEKNLGMWQDYMQYGPQYDTNNDCPINPGESDMVEQLSFKKQSVDTRNNFAQPWLIWSLITGKQKDSSQRVLSLKNLETQL